MVSYAGFYKNVQNYAENSTVHGIAYVFNKKIGFLDRLLWLLIMIFSLAAAALLVEKSFTMWRSNQVITTLKTNTKPISQLNFPAITICGEGNHMELVKKAIYKRFLKWKDSNNNTRSIEDDFNIFLKDVFQIQEKNVHILDILKTMIYPKFANWEKIRKNQIACADKKKERKKRATHEEILLQCEFRFYIDKYPLQYHV